MNLTTQPAMRTFEWIQLKLHYFSLALVIVVAAVIAFSLFLPPSQALPAGPGSVHATTPAPAVRTSTIYIVGSREVATMLETALAQSAAASALLVEVVVAETEEAVLAFRKSFWQANFYVGPPLIILDLTTWGVTQPPPAPMFATMADADFATRSLFTEQE